MCSCNPGEAAIDARRLTPRLRHALAFSRFKRLETQQAFRLVNNHDPWPLLAQRHARHSGAFAQDGQKQGPDV